MWGYSFKYFTQDHEVLYKSIETPKSNLQVAIATILP